MVSTGGIERVAHCGGFGAPGFGERESRGEYAVAHSHITFSERTKQHVLLTSVHGVVYVDCTALCLAVPAEIFIPCFTTDVGEARQSVTTRQIDIFGSLDTGWTCAVAASVLPNSRKPLDITPSRLSGKRQGVIGSPGTSAFGPATCSAGYQQVWIEAGHR